MLSFRDHPQDKAWNYLRPQPLPKKYIRMVPRGANTFECMVLDGLPSKTTSNSDDPPGSYYTRDTFTPHPTIPDAWKYLGRLDDRVTLVNGEKVLPIPYEHAIRQSELVKEAVVFGAGKTVPGLLVVPSQQAASLSKSEILEALLPQIELANAKAEEFGRISPEMVDFLEVGTEYPRTDKDSVIRAAFYREFSKQIDAVYERFEAPQLQAGATARQLGYEELVEYLLDLFRSKLGNAALQPTTDFFEGGIDSRQAIVARSQILREIDVGGKPVGSNVIFEYPNVELLARYLYALRTGTAVAEEDEISVMRELIAKYSDFPPREAGSLEPTGDALVSFSELFHEVPRNSLLTVYILVVDRCDRFAWRPHASQGVEDDLSKTRLLPRACSDARRRQGQSDHHLGGQRHSPFTNRRAVPCHLSASRSEPGIPRPQRGNDRGARAQAYRGHTLGMGRQLQSWSPQFRIAAYQGGIQPHQPMPTDKDPTAGSFLFLFVHLGCRRDAAASDH